jgi:DNA polymerase-1
MEQEVVGISLCDGSSTFYIDIAAFIETPRSTCLELLRHIFSNPELVVGHNILFDLKALMRLGIPIPYQAKWYDTMTVEHLIDERSEKSLKKMAERYLDAKTVSYEEASKSGIHSRKFAEYAKNDAQWTWEIFNIQIKRWEDRVKDLYLHLEEPFLRPLLEMETTGILVDQKRVAKQLPKLKARTVDVECMVLDALGERYNIQMSLFSDVTTVASSFNMSSPQQLKNKLKSFGVEIPVVDGKESLDKAVLASLVDKHPSIPLLLEHRKLRKLFSAFFDPLPQLTDSDGRIRPHFHNTGTRTGRLSCSEPNIQQLPKAVCAVCGHGKVTKEDECKKCGAYVIQVRKCFVAPEGKTLITCDYSGQEIRVLAHISQDPTMIDALLKGKDLHLTTANQFYNLGIPEEALYTNDPLFEESKEKFKQERDRAKIINFGIAYGKGAYGFSQDFKISEEEAQGILDKYFQGFPKVKEAIEKCRRDIKKTGVATSMTGRQRHFEENEQGYYPNSAFREAFNFLIQGFSADMIRMASVGTWKLAQEHPEWELKQIATVHDENVYEVKDEYLAEAKKEIRKVFEGVLPVFSVPMTAEVGSGDSYGTAK